MKKKISLCGGCKSKGHPHRCFICGNHNVIVYYCDKCGRIIQGDVYWLNKKDLCLDCLKDACIRKGV